MKRNIGAADRIIRIILAMTISLLYYFNIIEGVAADVMVSIALILLFTSLLSFCPLYSLLNLTTLRKQHAN